MKLTLHVWRQAGPEDPGRFETHALEDVSPDASFLELLDQLNHGLEEEGEPAIAFDYDCREGICGSCSLVIDGSPHGEPRAVTTCQLHARDFEDGQELRVEPFRADAFPIVKDLVVDRSSLDRIIQAGGYVSVNSGAAPDANAILVEKRRAEESFAAAQCIGCGACVAACPNASGALFVAAKAAHLSALPQGQPERDERALAMAEKMDAEGLGSCSNHGVCEAACPKEISVDTITRLNRDVIRARLRRLASKSDS